MLHSLATMVGVLREDPGSLGLVSGVGMHMTKHAPPCTRRRRPGPRVAPPGAAGVQPPTARRGHHRRPPRGRGHGGAYTVAHGRTRAAEWGLVLADVAPGVRAYGRVEDPKVLAALEAEEWVGRSVTPRGAPVGSTSWGVTPAGRARCPA